MADLNQLKEELKKELVGTTNDFSRILSLSQQIAALDENNVRFSVDASHISRLGLELVAKQETAVAELVKNGYDADALQVDLIFKNIDKSGGSLEIIDNGHGMTRDNLRRAIERHATSKIRTLEDLSAITTMGFRGEAVPAIASVSRLSITTTAAGTEGV